MVIIKCTPEQWETIYTAVRMEYLKNYGNDPDIQRQLEDAIKVISEREVCK